MHRNYIYNNRSPWLALCSLALISVFLFAYAPLTLADIDVCRDPDLGGQLPASSAGVHKYLLVGGNGAGIGNFLIFYPSVYYFALLTGRDILIMDDSLIGEMCKSLRCGFPLLSEIAVAYPKLKNEVIRGVNTVGFSQHISGENPVHDVLVRGDGYKLMSGWYGGHKNATKCIARVTGCGADDVFCHDRHALKRLVRGPFYKSSLTTAEEGRVIGVPKNLKHAMITLPHAYSPRLDAAIHLRTQFMAFEQSVGADDGDAWTRAMTEVNNWLACSSSDCGQQLFRTIEERIMEVRVCVCVCVCVCVVYLCLSVRFSNSLSPSPPPHPPLSL